MKSIALLLAGIVSAVLACTSATQAAPPPDPKAKLAYDALERNCSRCHQDGSLQDRLKPAGGFGFVLDFEKLTQDPHFIAPGNPDASVIVQKILNEEMPYDVFYDGRIDIEPVTAEELTAIRDWIASLGADTRTACNAKDPLRIEGMMSAMSADLGTLDKDRVSNTRYLTLTHLTNACADPEKMTVFRQASVKLLNSLSRNSTVVKLETIDDDQSILRFNLSDLGWTPEDWDHIVAAYPYAALPDSEFATALEASTRTPLAFVRADWFAATASRSPLYEALLDLPQDFAGLQHKLSVDVEANIRDYLADRAGFQVSGVSANNRLIERHAISTGYFWTSYDFAGNRARQSLFEFPVGPGQGDFDFSHDGGESIFSLPNGYQGYYLNSAAGAFLAQGPTNIVRDLSRRDLAVTNGISCMGCHDQGIRKAKDDIRPSVVDNRTFPLDVRDTVAALYPTNDEMDAILAQDAAQFASAMASAGLDPTLKWQGIEMINALAQQYDQDVELVIAAAEFDQTEEEFVSSLGLSGDEKAARLGRRLTQGLVPRDAFEDAFPEVVERVSSLVKLSALAAYVPALEKPAATAPKPAPLEQIGFDLAFTSDKSVYKQNDTAEFSVTSDRDCKLTLVNVDGSGKATLLFPNAFQSDNLIRVGKPFLFPGKDAAFQFRLGDVGVETVVAVCSSGDVPQNQIELDPGQTFTDLGDYAERLSRSITVEAAARVKKGEVPAKTGEVARRAIQIEVR